MDEEFDENGEFVVVLPKILEEKDRLGVTRNLAAELIANPYTTVGQFLQSIPDRDLKSLCDILEEQFEHDQKDEGDIAENFDDVVLVALMLANAEGLTVEGVEDVERFSNTLSVLLTAEGLKRKGLVKMHYEFISFGDDYADKGIAEKTDLFDEFMDDEDDDN